MDLLIDELFLFSKLDLKKIPFQMESVNLLHQYMHDYVEDASFDFIARDIYIQYISAGSALFAMADRDK